MFILVLNQTNLIQDGLNNKLVYKFPNSIKLTDKFIAISSISMFYSWFNITTVQGNNFIYFQWDSAGPIYKIVIPDGLYEISELNHFLQYWFIQNGFYYVSSNGNNVYMAEILVNKTRYAVQLNTYYNYDAGSLPADLSLPANFAGYPAQRQNPIITFPANFNIIVGYTAGFASNPNILNAYVPPTPTVTTNYASKSTIGTLSYLSNIAPEVQPNNNILFSISNINSPYSQPSSIIYSINPAVLAGEQITEVPPNFLWVKLVDGTYSQLTLTLLGNNLQPLTINDPNMTILLAIRDKDEAGLSTK
jgi:hypothetical protein